MSQYCTPAITIRDSKNSTTDYTKLKSVKLIEYSKQNTRATAKNIKISFNKFHKKIVQIIDPPCNFPNK